MFNMAEQDKLEQVFPPEKDRCGIGACHAVYRGIDESGSEFYIAVGRRVLSPSDVDKYGLTGKIAKDEVAVRVDIGRR